MKALLCFLLLTASAWGDGMTFQHDGVNNYNNTEDAGLQSNINAANGGGRADITIGFVSGLAALRCPMRFTLFHQALADSSLTATELTSCTLFVRIFIQGAATTDTISVNELDSFWAEGTGALTAGDTADVAWSYKDKVPNTNDSSR